MDWRNTDLIKSNTIGFVYKITHVISGEFYIGKKNLYSKKKGKKVESNWKNYYGSNKDFLSFVKQEGKDKFIREILLTCDGAYKLTYWEIDTIIKHNWIDDEKCWNFNLMGKFFKGKLKIN